MTELFPPEQMTSLSPRLKWLEKHQIKTKFNIDAEPEEPWEAWVGEYDPIKQVNHDGELYGPFLAIGSSEDEAVLTLALSNGWPLWNEEEGL